MNKEPKKDDEMICPRCAGTGYEKCWECDGNGCCPECGTGGCCPNCEDGEVDCIECDGHRFVPKE